MPIKAAYIFGGEHQLENEISTIRHMAIGGSFPTGVRKGYVVELFQRKNIFDEFKSKFWPFGDTAQGERKSRHYQKLYRDFVAEGEVATDADSENEEDTEESQIFAQEAHLRDFLAQNPERIESGLRIYEGDEGSGVEFEIDGGRIDLLGVDRDQRYVVIELKVSRGRNRTIGQLLYYMGWVDKNLVKDSGKFCRGMIIAKDIGNDLMLAIQRVPDVTLRKYNLNVTTEPVIAET